MGKISILIATSFGSFSQLSWSDHASHGKRLSILYICTGSQSWISAPYKEKERGNVRVNSRKQIRNHLQTWLPQQLPQTPKLLLWWGGQRGREGPQIFCKRRCPPPKQVPGDWHPWSASYAKSSEYSESWILVLVIVTMPQSWHFYMTIIPVSWARGFRFKPGKPSKVTDLVLARRRYGLHSVWLQYSCWSRYTPLWGEDLFLWSRAVKRKPFPFSVFMEAARTLWCGEDRAWCSLQKDPWPLLRSPQALT